MRVALLAGGTGAAKLAVGLAGRLGRELSVITNTADDDEFWGLLVCPDTDAVLYRLSGWFNEATGFGVRDETFHALDSLRSLGEATWFGLGDRDIGVHLLRNSLRARGARLSEVVAELGRRLGVTAQVIPMSDDPVRTRITTDDGEVSLQEWFVRDGCRPRVRAVRFQGIGEAQASPEAVAAVGAAEAVIIGPSNPVISIDPIIRVLSQHLSGRPVIAVSPVIGGRSLKGPTSDMLRQLGEAGTALAVARRYAGVATDFVLDSEDGGLAEAVAGLGMRAHVIDTVMSDTATAQRVATDVLDICTQRGSS
jgi:LPPG:FO 2-phospho-L-lactate transferase